jgi:hypothetical protein
MSRMSMSPAVDRYLQQLFLLRKASTAKSAERVLHDYMDFLRRSPGGNVKDRIIAFLAHCRQQGNCLRTLEKKRI